MAVRYFDADGKPVGENQFTLGNNNDERWVWFTYPFGDNGIEAIPGKAAGLEFAFRPSQDFDLAGLAFQAWPAPDEEAAIPPKPAPAKAKPDADE